MRFYHMHTPEDEDGYRHTFMLKTFVLHAKEMNEVRAWCESHFGDRGIKRWDFAPIAGQVYIADDDDAFAFRMRWC